MDGRIDPHGSLIGVFAGNFFIHLEQVAVFLFNHRPGIPFDGIGKVKINRQPRLADAFAHVTLLLGIAGGDVARHEVAETGVFYL